MTLKKKVINIGWAIIIITVLVFMCGFDENAIEEYFKKKRGTKMRITRVKFELHETNHGDFLFVDLFKHKTHFLSESDFRKIESKLKELHNVCKEVKSHETT